jgi:hypothetical protein
MHAASTVSPPDFLSNGGGSFRYIGGLFHHCFTALMRQFISLYDISLSPYMLSTNDFIFLPTFSSSDECGDEIARRRHSSSHKG